MDRSLLAVVAGAFTVTLFTLLAGIILIPLSIRIWLIPLGFLLTCLLVGAVGRLRALHLVLISFIIYLGLMVFLTVVGTLLAGIQFPLLHLDAILESWNGFQEFVNTFIPFLMVLSNMAAILRAMTGGESLLAIFLEFFVASAFIGTIGLLITGISGYVTGEPGLHVVTAPEPSVEAPPFTESTTVPQSAASEPAHLPPQSAPAAPMETPPSMPTPHPVEEAPPPAPSSKGGSPSAKAISSLKGKVTKHLKDTGRKAPKGQTRCPHCNATIIRGSRYCNSCEKAI